MSDHAEHNPGDHEDPLPGPTWIVTFLGVVLLAVIILGIWFVIQVVSGVASLDPSSASGGIALFAHIGGFLGGVAVGLLVRGIGPSGRPRSVRSSDRVGVG